MAVSRLSRWRTLKDRPSYVVPKFDWSIKRRKVNMDYRLPKLNRPPNWQNGAMSDHNAKRRNDALIRRVNNLCQDCGIRPPKEPWMLCQICIDENRRYRERRRHTTTAVSPQDATAPPVEPIRRPVVLPHGVEATVVWDGTSRERLSGMRVKNSRT